MRRLARIFLAGLLAALPLMLTLFVTAWLLSFLNQYLGPNSGFGSLLRSLGLGADASEYAPYFIGLGGIVGGIFMLGLMVQSRIGSWNALIWTVWVVSHVRASCNSAASSSSSRMRTL